MSPEKQRIAIAEACGVFICTGCNHEIDPGCCGCGDSINHYPDGHSPVPLGCTCGYDDAPKRKAAKPCCPDYLNNLNAMHEAEKCCFAKRPGYYSRAFVTELCGVLDYDMDTGMHDKLTICDLLHATAAQRAEALLRTIGKWEES